MRPGIVRALEWEILPKQHASCFGLRNTALSGELGNVHNLAVLRCVDHRGKKLTVVASAAHAEGLLGNGRAGARTELNLNDELFPVVINGWLISDG